MGIFKQSLRIYWERGREVMGVGKKQGFRFMVSAMVTLFLMVIIVRAVMMLISSREYLLWGLPVIAVSILDIYFLTRSLSREPQKMDTRLSTVIISMGATFGFSLVAIGIGDQLIQVPYMQWVQKVGWILAIVPYPFVVWALFCLKDCLTVVPEAHTVVASGIYRYSRHPLYVCYMVWAIANMMMFPTLSMMIGSVAQVIFLFVRLGREEELLLATFPEYKEYYKRTGLCGKR
jgi:protein-S-isoprenylcysteine O-methyltransferase Ste14